MGNLNVDDVVAHVGGVVSLLSSTSPGVCGALNTVVVVIVVPFSPQHGCVSVKTNQTIHLILILIKSVLGTAV